MTKKKTSTVTTYCTLLVKAMDFNDQSLRFKKMKEDYEWSKKSDDLHLRLRNPEYENEYEIWSEHSPSQVANDALEKKVGKKEATRFLNPKKSDGIEQFVENTLAFYGGPLAHINPNDTIEQQKKNICRSEAEGMHVYFDQKIMDDARKNVKKRFKKEEREKEWSFKDLNDEKLKIFSKMKKDEKIERFFENWYKDMKNIENLNVKEYVEKLENVEKEIEENPRARKKYLTIT